MLCATIKGPTFEEAVQQILSLPLEAGLLEFRLDNFIDLNEAFLLKLRDIRPLPVIFTLRDPKQGSNYKGSETERLRDLQRYAGLNPDYIDLESSCPPDFVEHIITRQPQTKVILSYHNFEETPADLEALLTEMQQIPAHLYKIATQCNNSCDALRLLNFTRNCKVPICTMGMGSHGEVTRVLGTVYGSKFTYASVSDTLQMVEGQLSLRTLIDTYHFPKLNANTAVYGLIGDPVSKSLSQHTHNMIFNEFHIPAVYVKMAVKIEELKEFISLTRALNFRGLSVTMPLKEDILKLIDFVDPYAFSIGAVNTLCYNPEGIFGFNTDGMGALNAIERISRVEGKHVMVIGAGGAAKAIIVEAIHRGARVTVINRNVQRALELAKQYPITVGALDEIGGYIEKGYDILINCTPEGLPFDPALLLAGKVVMDIKTVPEVTELIAKAIEKQCKIVYGYQMFIGQALEQFSLWFPGTVPQGEGSHLMEKCAKAYL